MRTAGFVNAKTGNSREENGSLELWAKWETIWSVARSGNVQQLRILCESDPSIVNCRNTLDESALHFACQFGNIECVKFLIEMGGSSWCNQSGKTPVKLAVQNGHTDIVKHLIESNQFGTESEYVDHLLDLAAKRKDFATMNVLELRRSPSLIVLPEEDQERKDNPVKRLAQREKNILEESKMIEIEAKLQPPVPLPDLGPLCTWSSNDVTRWIVESFPVIATTQMVYGFCRFNITGEVLVDLPKHEVLSLFQRLGVPPAHRGVIVESLMKLQPYARRYGFTELRNLPLAVGNATGFRVVGFIKSASCTPLHTCRRFVSMANGLDFPLPQPFSFVSMQGETIAKHRESSILVSNLGFIIIVQPEIVVVDD